METNNKKTLNFDATNEYVNYMLNVTNLEKTFGRYAARALPDTMITSGSDMIAFTKAIRKKILLIYVDHEERKARVIFETEQPVLEFTNFCPKIFSANEMYENNPTAYFVNAMKEILYRINPNFRLEATVVESKEHFTTDYDYYWNELPKIQRSFFQLLETALSYNAMITGADMSPIDVFSNAFSNEYYKYFNDGYEHTIEYINATQPVEEEKAEEPQPKEEKKEEISSESPATTDEEKPAEEEKVSVPSKKAVKEKSITAKKKEVNNKSNDLEMLDTALNTFLIDKEYMTFTVQEFHKYCKEHIENFLWSTKRLSHYVKSKASIGVLVRTPGKASSDPYLYQQAVDYDPE